MAEQTIAAEIDALAARCPDREDDPEGFRRNVEQRAILTDKRRAYQASKGWKVA